MSTSSAPGHIWVEQKRLEMKNQIDFKVNLSSTLLILLLLLGNLLAAQNPTIDPPRKWATTMGGVNFDYITDAVKDGQGGLYVTGYTNSPNFPTTLPGAPGAGYDIFVARLDSFGAVLWSTRYGGAGTDFGNAIARDAAGNLVVAAKLGGQGTFVTDSIYKGTGDDILVLKLNGNGAFIGAMRYGGNGADEAIGIATDAQNQIVVVGNSASTNISTTIGTYNGTNGDAFVLRLRSDLTRHWAMRYGGNSFEKANDVVVDAAGNVYVAGETGSADYPQTISTYQGSGGAKAFVMRFDSLGTRDWAQRYGGNAVERAYALDLPINGGLLVAGYTSSSNFPTTIVGQGGAGTDAFLIHLNADGTRDFARRLGGNLDDLAQDLSSDAAGNIFMAGETQSSNFPSTNRRFAGAGRDQFIAKFGANGLFQWSFPIGGIQTDYATASLASSASSIYLVGHTQSLNYPQTLPGTGGNTARGSVLRLRDCLGQNADFSFQHVCEFDTVYFQNLSVSGTSDTLAHRWYFGDGDSSDVVNPWHYYSVPGAYQVRLRVTSPCGIDSSITKTVNVYPGPRVDWTHTNSCATRYTEFMDSTMLDTVVGSYEDAWKWEFGNGDSSLVQNPTYIYANPGQYQVQLTVWTNHGCVDTASHGITVHHRPYADFGFTDICLRDTAFFADSTTLSGDSLSPWSWNFGDGGNSMLQNPSYLYAGPDTFAVQLIVTSNEACADTLTKFIKVLPLPTVNFGMTEVCWPDTVMYSDSSSIVGDLIASYEWHFGDTSTAVTQNATHAYGVSGNYDVVLWVYTASGCADSLLQQLKVHDKPNANFGFENVCWPNITQFSDSASVQADSLVSWHWDFGDGGFDSIASPSYSYALADTYAVSLEVISAFGCRDTSWQNVIVLPKPTAAFNPPSVCFPLPITLNDNSTIVGDNLNNWQWDFGDGATANGLITLHSYANAGDYLVTLIAGSASGCLDTIQDTVHIYPQPIAAYSVENVCDQDTVFFTDSSSVSSGYIAQYLYSFGDGNTSNDSVTHHIYGQAGTYLSSLLVTTDHNCINTVLQSVTVHPLPDPQPTVIGYPDICIGDTIQIREFQSFVSYEWETGDQTNSISVHDRSDFIVLTVVDANNCENSDSVEVRFHPVPRPNAVIAPGPMVFSCDNDSLFLTAGGSYASYQWSDGATTGIRYVGQSGDLSVLVINGFGCADTSDTVTVEILQAPARPIITSLGDTLVVPSAASYQWYLNSLSIPSGTQQKYLPRATGSYYCETWDAQGCKVVSDTVTSIVSAESIFIADFSVFPNPFSSSISIEGTLAYGGQFNIQLTNVLGQVVYSQMQRQSAGSFHQEILVPHLPAGYYLLQLEMGKEKLHRALIKQ